ncbi:hypothetical protein JCM9140_4791 [Halalkalibacter wakoensis JCM 9140]|uniref:Uncharacterized protein n=1 Tax=Halalkalibacter wakoensis JCM 9140 TaxID=1236970 RepID=W4Q913_9BACI|nr:hypothetical protein [Halalkalibacter wakoensis]GAE28546.1 hypothetical protein JCM9140_4791 [Halalkalibacter wakoensis JCM 9140]
MEATHYDDLSIFVPKNQLDKLINGVLQSKYRIFWGFNNGKMILNIYNSEVNNKLIFKRHQGFLELVEAKLKSPHVLKVLDQDIDFSVKVNSQDMDESCKQLKELIYREIDTCLEQLSECLKRRDERSSLKIKDRLAELTVEWNRTMLRSNGNHANRA